MKLMSLLHLTNKLYFTIAMAILTLVGCKGAGEDKISEGIIEYDITYPYFKDEFMIGLLPKKMNLEFKNNIYKSTVEISMFGTSLISNCLDSTLIMTFHFGKKKFYTVLDAQLTETMIQKNGVPDVVELNSTDSIAGVLCKKHMGVFDNLKDGYDAEIFETHDINIKNSNWCNPYRDIDGVLMGYEIDQFGLQMRFRGNQVKDTLINDSIFNIPQNYKKVPLERMLYEVEQLFQTL